MKVRSSSEYFIRRREWIEDDNGMGGRGRPI
jgi:hypothetical protein